MFPYNGGRLLQTYRKGDHRMNNPFDLKKIFPDYFFMSVFRLGIVLVILLVLYTGHSNDWRNDFKAYDCPASDLYNGCFIQSFDEYNGVFVPAGSYVGEKPNEDYFLFNQRLWIIIFGTFLINHLMFIFKNKKIYPTRRNKKK